MAVRGKKTLRKAIAAAASHRLDTLKGPSREIARTHLAKPATATQAEFMNSAQRDILHIRAEIVDIASRHNCVLPEGAVDALARYACALQFATSSVPSPASDTVVDPRTKLELPPKPRTPYSRGIDGKRVHAETFLKAVWSDYIDAGLLYSEHIRKVDSGLYYALHHISKKGPNTFASYLESLSVVTRSQVAHPPQHLQDQAKIIAASVNLARAQSHSATAKAHLDTRS
jgi:hypothetical protein